MRPWPEDEAPDARPYCRECGRFVSHVRPVVGVHEWGEFIADVIGDCRTHGVGVPAGPSWLHDWDSWTWTEVPA